MPKVYPGPEESAKRLADACMGQILQTKVRDDITTTDKEVNHINYMGYRASAKIQISENLFCFLMVQYHNKPTDRMMYSFHNFPGGINQPEIGLVVPHKIECNISIMYKSRTVTGVKIYNVESMKFIVPEQFTNPGVFIQRIAMDYITDKISKKEKLVSEFRAKLREKKKWLKWADEMKWKAPAAAEGETLKEFEERTLEAYVNQQSGGKNKT